MKKQSSDIICIFNNVSTGFEQRPETRWHIPPRETLDNERKRERRTERSGGARTRHGHAHSPIAEYPSTRGLRAVMRRAAVDVRSSAHAQPRVYSLRHSTTGRSTIRSQQFSSSFTRFSSSLSSLGTCYAEFTTYFILKNEIFVFFFYFKS